MASEKFISHVTEHDTDSESEYWAKFYSRHEINGGSTFSEFINNYPEIPDTILDIGCGNGRDSLAFASTGKTVLGLDRSTVGLENASHMIDSHDTDMDLAFRVCDVSKTKEVQNTIELLRQYSGGKPICFYLRFFLHSIPEEVQNSLLESLSANAKVGDAIAVEFRTDKDTDNQKEFGTGHYRRYQSATEFSDNLQNYYGWDIDFEQESQGLSIYGDEDPYLYRAVAVRH